MHHTQLRVHDAAGVALIGLFALALHVEARTIDFSGHVWQVHRGFGGPGPNRFADDAETVWVDDQGQLHMKIRKVGGAWFCSEVYTQESLGYGTYRFQLASDAEMYDPWIVVGLFTYLDDDHETDIELTRQGDEHARAGNFTVQPYFIPGNMFKFELGLHESSTHEFAWRPDSIYFRSLDGHHVNPPTPRSVIAEWTYAGDSIPLPGAEKLYINFYLFQGVPPANQSDAELVVTNVDFVPAALVPAPWTRFTVAKGELVGGDLQSVQASDDVYLGVDALPDASGRRFTTTTTFDAASAAGALTRLDLTINASTSANAASAMLQLYDYDASSYVNVGAMPLTAVDLRRKIEISDPGRYLRDEDAHVRARIVSRSIDATHRLRVDLLEVAGAQ